MSNRGFTLIEILITIGIVTTIAAFSVPMAVDFYNTQIIKSTSDEIFSALKKAQAFSLYRRNDQVHGVLFDEGGDTYQLFSDDDDDTNDSVYKLEGITVDYSTTLSEDDTITFEKGTGIPNDFVVITLTKGAIIQDISICESGLIEIGNDCENI
jgi:prepilin-type N-terminal cleavage/methylation domain-containing protein